MTILDASADWRVINLLVRAREHLADRQERNGPDNSKLINDIDSLLYQDLTVPDIIMAYRRAAPYHEDYDKRHELRDAWASRAADMILINARMLAAEPEEE